MPELTKRGVLESFPGVLELNLLNASDAAHEHFLPVQYNEKIPSVKEYGSVQIFYKDQLIKSIKVEIV
ncbi:hypothetical protein SAMN04488522_10674 [Pedobacter caeni]|uniref:Uncharacterized protein n=2 Tax=Pedobacter caeni TaxID=288992 RepID=A0A1M5KSJ0_9SPHI|nr:hypothetical protein SAMN04488522_10674 [Pedobacter caeni]